MDLKDDVYQHKLTHNALDRMMTLILMKKNKCVKMPLKELISPPFYS
jgi:hypothetical protein